MRFDWQRLIPRYWIQNDPSDWNWDALLNEALDTYGVAPDGSYEAKVGPLTVWTANYPYAYGHCFRPINDSRLPAVATRKRLRRMLDNVRFDLVQEVLKRDRSN